MRKALLLILSAVILAEGRLLDKPVAAKATKKDEKSPPAANTPAKSKAETQAPAAMPKPAPKVEVKPAVANSKPTADSKPKDVDPKHVSPKPVTAAKAADKAVPQATAKAIATKATAADKVVPQAVIAVAVSHTQADKSKATPATVHDHAVAAQKSADEATHHLEMAKAAFKKTRMNVKEIMGTGKKIESTAGDIKTLYTPDKPKPKATTPAPEPEFEFPKFAWDKDCDAKCQAEREQYYASRVISQIIWGVLYYLIIVKHYPSWRNLPQPNLESQKLQEMNEISATFQASPANCFLSWCCSGPRAAHTFYSTLGMNYWAGCIMMSCFPCCTLWVVNSFSPLNEKLGGEKRNPFVGLICACCFSCCVIAQDAESLDRITEYKTNFCSVTPPRR